MTPKSLISFKHYLIGLLFLISGCDLRTINQKINDNLNNRSPELIAVSYIESLMKNDIERALHYTYISDAEKNIEGMVDIIKQELSTQATHYQSYYRTNDINIFKFSKAELTNDQQNAVVKIALPLSNDKIFTFINVHLKKHHDMWQVKF